MKKLIRMKNYDFWHSVKINVKSRSSLPNDNKRGRIYIYKLTAYVLCKAMHTTIDLKYANNWITWFSSTALLEEMWDRKHGILSYKVMQIPMFPLIGDISQRGSLPLCGHPDYDTCLLLQGQRNDCRYSCSSGGSNLNRSGERVGWTVKMFLKLLWLFQVRRESNVCLLPGSEVVIHLKLRWIMGLQVPQL